LPIVIYAIFDQECTDVEFEQNSSLYEIGQLNLQFKVRDFIRWVFIGSVQALPISMFSFLITSVAVNQDSMEADFWFSGSMTFSLAVIIANLKIFLFSYKNSVLSVSIVIGSIVVYFLSFDFLNAILFSEQYQILTRLFGSWYFWFGLLLIVVVTTFIDLGFTRHNYLKKNSGHGTEISEDMYNYVRMRHTSREIDTNSVAMKNYQTPESTIPIGH